MVEAMFAAVRLGFLSGCVLLAACGDGSSTRVCFGTDHFCDDAFAANRSPHADAGGNQSVSEGARVTLDGSDSLDPDGSIASYSWSQQSGPAVALAQATASQAAFDAPAVTQPTTLVFRLTVTDQAGASDSDSVTISVAPSAATALRHRMTWLDQNPPAPCGVAASPGCWADLGLWLGARVVGAQVLATEDVTALLDALRVIEITHVEPPPGDLPAAAGRLFVLGQSEVARYTESLDPGTAERARRHAHGSPPGVEDWHQALNDPEARAWVARSGMARTALLQALQLRSGSLPQ